jgi:glycosyltransferase involved in cell wall biosynthesis
VSNPATVGSKPLRVLLVAESASAQFGGEAALPLHYYRVLRSRDAPVWMITHSRVRAELEKLYPQDIGSRILMVEDDSVHRFLWRLSTHLPDRLAYFSTGLVSRWYTQLQQRRLAASLVKEMAIDVVHQPMPVSPKEPSWLWGLGAPVVIGPMNGGMSYPPAFAAKESAATRLAVSAGRWAASLMNRLVPGKSRAALLLVANQRTAVALPQGHGARVAHVVENGVDLSLWRPHPSNGAGDDVVRFAFLGRLVELKAVDMLIDAFVLAREHAPMSLTIIGDGSHGSVWRAQAERLGLQSDAPGVAGHVHFTGWQPQAAAAQLLAQHQALVMPSLMECGGAVVLEAMSMALPVVATDWGGPADYIDARTGILVPPTSREALVAGFAQALRELAVDPQRRAALGAAGREKVLREFDWERKVDHMLGIFEQVASGRP